MNPGAVMRDPGSIGTDSTTAGMVLRDLTGLASILKSYIKSAVCAVFVNRRQ